MKNVFTLDEHKVPYVYSKSKGKALGNVILSHGITLDKREKHPPCDNGKDAHTGTP